MMVNNELESVSNEVTVA